MNISESKELLDRAYKSELSNIEVARQLTGNTYTEHYAAKVTSIARQIIDKLLKDSAVDKEGRVLEQITYGDGSQLRKILANVTKVQNKSPKDLLIYHGYDPLQFAFDKHQFNIWQAYSKQDGVTDLVSSRLRVKPVQKVITQDIIKNVFNELKPPNLPTHKVTKSDKSKIFILPIVDFHLGKFSWADETGFDYDLKIAERMYKQCINELLNRIDQYNIPIDTVLFPIGQDFYNVDNEENTTTKGTPQDVDTRWQKMFRKGVEVSMWALEKLKQLQAEIKVCYVAGNHDYKMSFFLTETLRAFYRNNKNIEFRTDLHPRQYYELGNNMIVFTHADKIPQKRLYNLIASERADIWGRTKYRELLRGHTHHEHLEVPIIEHQGFKIRTISTITAQDNYHTKAGYIGTTLQMQGFVWDWENGLETIINAVVRDKSNE